MTTANGQRAIIISDNLTMTGPSSSPLRRILRAPFTRRTWAELAYSIVSALLDVGALVFIVPMLLNGALWAASAPGVRKLALPAGENVSPPPPLRPNPRVQVRTDPSGWLPWPRRRAPRYSAVAAGSGSSGFPAPRSPN